jgi:hypothetical protein
MRRWSSMALAMTLAVTVAFAMTARAQPRGLFPSVSPPILLQLEGTVHDAADAARKAGFEVVSLGFYGHADATRYFGVDDARTAGPETPLDGKDVLNEVAPLRPNLLVTGSPHMMQPLLESPDGTRIRMEGLVRVGSRTYYLRSLEVNPAPRDRSGRDDGRHDDLAVALPRAERGQGGR